MTIEEDTHKHNGKKMTIEEDTSRMKTLYSISKKVMLKHSETKITIVEEIHKHNSNSQKKIRGNCNIYTKITNDVQNTNCKAI